MQRRQPIHIGGSSQAAATRAGAYHCNFLPDVGTDRELHDSYRAALMEAGRTPAEFEITVNGCVYVSHDVEQAQRLVHRALEYMYERYMAWEVESGDAPPAASDPLDAGLLESLCIVGTPEQVADQLLELRTRLEPDRGLRCDLRCAGTGSRLRRTRRRSVSIGDTDMTEQEAAEGDKVLVHYTAQLDDG